MAENDYGRRDEKAIENPKNNMENCKVKFEKLVTRGVKKLLSPLV